jgi:hypothetical protein
MNISSLILPFVACRADIPDDPIPLIHELIEEYGSPAEVEVLQVQINDLEDEIEELAAKKYELEERLGKNKKYISRLESILEKLK